VAQLVSLEQLVDDRELADAVERAASGVARLRSAGTAAERLRAVGQPDARQALEAVRVLARRLPRVEAPFSETPAGAELRAWFRPGRWLALDRAPVALLRLPATEEEYLRGRPKQALRTNLTAARRAGLRCAQASSAAEVWDALHHIAARRGQPPGRMVPRRPSGLRRDFGIAWDATGEPVALVETIVDGAWAGLAVLVSASDHPQASLARYLLHAHTVRGLVDQDVQVLVVGGSMLLTQPGVRYFQRRTGFVPVWLRPSPAPRAAPVDAPFSLTVDDLLAAVPAT
jgi:hypothetical protein